VQAAAVWSATPSGDRKQLLHALLKRLGSDATTQQHAQWLGYKWEQHRWKATSEKGQLREALREAAQQAGRDGFAQGQRVEARFGGKPAFYRGRVEARRGDGTYDVAYDDGDREEGVRASLVRAVSSGSGAGEPRGKGGAAAGAAAGAAVAGAAAAAAAGGAGLR
jgi:hypothetical protein